jgi:hypothetical protein
MDLETIQAVAREKVSENIAAAGAKADHRAAVERLITLRRRWAEAFDGLASVVPQAADETGRTAIKVGRVAIDTVSGEPSERDVYATVVPATADNNSAKQVSERATPDEISVIVAIEGTREDLEVGTFDTLSYIGRVLMDGSAHEVHGQPLTNAGEKYSRNGIPLSTEERAEIGGRRELPFCSDDIYWGWEQEKANSVANMIEGKVAVIESTLQLLRPDQPPIPITEGTVRD